VNERTPSTHVAPFWHGADAQSSIHEHTRSLVSVAAAVSIKSSAHAADTAEHTRLLVAVAALVSYVTPTEHVDTDAHTRSDERDATDGCGSYSEPAVHVRDTVQDTPPLTEKVSGPHAQIGPK
jgi:hypothetical protein